MEISPRDSPDRRDGVFIGNVAEKAAFRLLRAFDPTRMPFRNQGYDIICNNGAKIEVKAATPGERGSWGFMIKQNKIADYFICLAFGDKENLRLERAWIFPGSDINDKSRICITNTNTGLRKWAKYERSINDIVIDKHLPNQRDLGSVSQHVDISICDVCKYEWLPRTDDPKKCPKCGAREWKKKEQKA